MKTKTQTTESFGQLVHTIRLSLTRRLQRNLAKNGFDINVTQVRVLQQLSRHETMSAKELARAVEHDGGALTRLLDRLQETGCIVRRTNADDRRAVDISLTTPGRALLKSVQQCINSMYVDVLDELDRDERVQLLSLLERVRSRLDALDDKRPQVR